MTGVGAVTPLPGNSGFRSHPGASAAGRAAPQGEGPAEPPGETATCVFCATNYTEKHLQRLPGQTDDQTSAIAARISSANKGVCSHL